MSKTRIAAGFSAAVLALAAPVVMHFEGLQTSPYRDPVGILTVCYGETHAAMRTYTAHECRLMLADSLAAHGVQIQPCIPESAPDRVKAASLSFAYNVGAAKFCGSTMARKFQAGDWAGGCAELSRWVYAGGQVLPGLVRRRAQERAVCEGRA